MCPGKCNPRVKLHPAESAVKSSKRVESCRISTVPPREGPFLGIVPESAASVDSAFKMKHLAGQQQGHSQPLIRGGYDPGKPG